MEKDSLNIFVLIFLLVTYKENFALEDNIFAQRIACIIVHWSLKDIEHCHIVHRIRTNYMDTLDNFWRN